MTKARDIADIADVAVPDTIFDAKGDILAASANDTPAKVTIGANETLLIADSAQTAGVKWSSQLQNVTLTTPRVDYPVLRGAEEDVSIVASAATGTINIDTSTASIFYYTSNASANFTLNVRGSSTVTLNSVLPVGDSITVVFMNTNGATAYYPTAFQIDGSAVTPRWQGGTAPTSGNASSIDIYTLTIIKTAATPTYVVLASQTRFA